MAVPRIALALLVASTAARAEGPAIDGEYDSPLGRVRVEGDGATFRGVLVAPSRACAFRAGEEVLRATLLDDSLAGQVRVCLSGKGCAAREAWATAVLLADAAGLSGAGHVEAKGCRAPALGKRGGIAFRRRASASVVATATATATSTAASARPPTRSARTKARDAMKDGAAWLAVGSFEKARVRFLAAVELDPSIPEAYNGVGVTYRMRDDLPRALEWYKRALAVNPDFGDAYYNMACVYALGGSRALALRYLQIAALNGYATANGMDEDPDLESLRADPGYRALVGARM
jgi:tetratricopeptide (TPR) repeat protein